MFILFSCGKKTNISGTIYSKNNIPVPNVDVDVDIYKGSDYPYNTIARVKTDQDGQFKITFHFRNQRGYKLHCHCDSGTARTWYLNRGSNQTIDLHLN